MERYYNRNLKYVILIWGLDDSREEVLVEIGKIVRKLLEKFGKNDKEIIKGV